MTKRIKYREKFHLDKTLVFDKNYLIYNLEIIVFQ